MDSNSFNLGDLNRVQEIIGEAALSSLAPYLKASTASYKADGSIVTEADLAMQESLANALLKSYPGIDMLSEEMSESQQREVLQSSRDYWCLDPLDGTNNFHLGLPLFSVSLALVSAGEIVLAVVYDPVRKEYFAALKGQGLWLNNTRHVSPVQPEVLKKSIALVDFKRLGLAHKRPLIETPPYKSQRNLGSCALEWAWLAAGRAQLLLHGSEKYWDYAAGCLLLAESGGASCTLEGDPVFNASLEPRSVIAACNNTLFKQWNDWVRPG